MTYSLIPDLKLGIAGVVQGITYYNITDQASGVFGHDDLWRKQNKTARELSAKLNSRQRTYYGADGEQVRYPPDPPTQLHKGRRVPRGAYMPDCYPVDSQP